MVLNMMLPLKSRDATTWPLGENSNEQTPDELARGREQVALREDIMDKQSQRKGQSSHK